MNSNQYQNPQDQKATSRYSLWNAAFILMIIITVCSGFLIIPLAWMIPMTLMVKKARDEVNTPYERSRLGLAICCLLFCGIIPGILAIIATSLFTPNLSSWDNEQPYSNLA
ncbi:hypothetical protein JN01_0157 [Entomoplasma freundtii]|uniref:Uncharacterized protein n=1 Tax=Entomoplasma freundtii TaxID=74700 RepID=A0A2K8NRZ4_9MOLU|nr:hypothetical protein [Entomoplasma freundtii]ATZ16622.1 hypothetical protein EFREU_v1c06020 [Entomoplasma freundtii]TDY58211.1 hypothetical protein JN01_0157 [Entomoplasma freundtii]